MCKGFSQVHIKVVYEKYYNFKQVSHIHALFNLKGRLVLVIATWGHKFPGWLYFIGWWFFVGLHILGWCNFLGLTRDSCLPSWVKEIFFPPVHNAPLHKLVCEFPTATIGWFPRCSGLLEPKHDDAGELRSAIWFLCIIVVGKHICPLGKPPIKLKFWGRLFTEKGPTPGGSGVNMFRFCSCPWNCCAFWGMPRDIPRSCNAKSCWFRCWAAPNWTCCWGKTLKRLFCTTGKILGQFRKEDGAIRGATAAAAAATFVALKPFELVFRLLELTKEGSGNCIWLNRAACFHTIKVGKEKKNLETAKAKNNSNREGEKGVKENTCWREGSLGTWAWILTAGDWKKGSMAPHRRRRVLK